MGSDQKAKDSKFNSINKNNRTGNLLFDAAKPKLSKNTSINTHFVSNDKKKEGKKLTLNNKNNN